MTPAQLSRTVQHALRGPLGVAVPGRVVIESPPRRGNGDYGTGVAMQAARAAGEDAPALAGRLGELLARLDGIAGAEVSGPGFLNITLDGAGRTALLLGLAGPDASAPDTSAHGDPAHDDPAREARDDPARDAERWAAATGEPYDRLLRRTDASPLFRVQYAHARTRALLRNAADLGLTPEPGAGGHTYGAAAERTLLALLADQQRIAEAAAGSAGRAPGRAAGRAAGETADRARLARHLVAVAGACHGAHETCPPLPRGDEKPTAAHRARLALTEVTGAVLAGGLTQLGVTAPAHL